MPVSPEELFKLLALLAEEENLKVTVKKTMKGTAVVSTGALIGGLLGGPVGLALGGILGSIAGALMARKFKPVPEILREMDPVTRDQLFEHFQNLITGFGTHDAVTLAGLVVGDPIARMQVVNGLINFFLTILKMDVTR